MLFVLGQVSKIRFIPVYTYCAGVSICPRAMPEKLTISPELLTAQPKAESTLEQASRAFFYSLAQSPVNGVVQIADKVVGTSVLPSVQFIAPPQEASFASVNWHAQQFGQAAGMLPWLMAMHKGGSYLLNRAVGLEANALGQRALQTGRVLTCEAALTGNASGFLTRRTAIEVGASALSGAAYGAFLTPGKADEDLLSSRLAGAGSNAITFAAMTSGMRGLNSAGLKSKVVSGVLAGGPAGIVAAESHSLLCGKGLASAEQVWRSAYGFSIIGGGFGLAEARLTGAGKTKTETLILENKNSAVVAPDASIAEPAARVTVPFGEVFRRPGEVLQPGEILVVTNPKTGETLQARVELKPGENGGQEIHLEGLDGKTLGMVRYKICEALPENNSPQLLYGNPRTKQSFLWLDMMRVELPGKGIKEALVEHLRAESVRLGFEGRVKLQAVNQFGTVSAIPWYKAGFRPQEGSLYFGPKFELASQLLRGTVESGRKLSLAEGANLGDLLMYLPSPGK